MFSFGTFVNVLTVCITFIRMSGQGRGARRGKPTRQEAPVPDDIASV